MKSNVQTNIVKEISLSNAQLQFLVGDGWVFLFCFLLVIIYLAAAGKMFCGFGAV